MTAEKGPGGLGEKTSATGKPGRGMGLGKIFVEAAKLNFEIGGTVLRVAGRMVEGMDVLLPKKTGDASIKPSDKGPKK